VRIEYVPKKYNIKLSGGILSERQVKPGPEINLLTVRTQKIVAVTYEKIESEVAYQYNKEKIHTKTWDTNRQLNPYPDRIAAYQELRIQRVHTIRLQGLPNRCNKKVIIAVSKRFIRRPHAGQNGVG